LKKTDGATQIEAAYLVWETSVQGKNNTDLVKKAANKAVYFAGSTDKGAFTKKVNASYAAVDMREPHLGTKEYTFSCMYVDVTSVVQKYGYGKYGVANIPYAASMKTSNTDKGTHAGESSSAWQLIVIEKNSKANVRAVSLKIGSHFNYQWEGSTWTKNPVSMNLNLGDCKTNQYINEDSEVSGELLLLGTNSGIVKSNATEQKSFGLELYDRVNKDKNKNDKLAYSNSGLIGHSYFYHGDTQLSSKLSSVRGILTDFSMNKDDGAHPGFATNKFRAEASDSSWSTLFVVGLAVDVADYDLISNQDTTVTSAASATVTGGIQVKTDQSDTGYYDGKLVVTLDDALTPIKGETIFTVLDKGVTKPTKVKYIYGTDKELKYDAAKHTLTLSGYDNKADGSYVDYTISCTVKENSGKKVFKNQYEVAGKLRSQKYSTGIEKKTEPLSSQAVPMYRFTVKMDKTAGKNIDIQKFNSSGRYTSLFTVSADQKLLAGDYYVGSVDIPYNGIISAVPTFNTGYVFSKWIDLNEKTNVSTDRKATSDMVNDTTYAYERSMPAYNMTLTLTGVLDEAVYTVHHWKQKADGIASTRDDKNYELVETETKKAQIGSRITPAVKTYTGFDSPKTQTKEVTADGKMVIDYYYERHLYNVTLNAGTGIEKTTGGGSYRYGQSVTIDAAVKEGYHWLNWKGNYKGGSGGEQTVDAKKFVFTMPAGNVTMTANAEANKYTIHFDPNGGFGHIDDIEATYDEDVTLPDVWNADGTATYVKYTLDGQNVTEDVISGAIPKAMMAGYEEEETEIEDTETNDDENSDIEDEDTGKDGNDADIVETDTPDDMDEAEATETEDDSDDANDEELDKIEEDKKAEEPKKKVYASIFMGWALEDGKDTFIPKWKAGDIVQNLVA
ncbi:InlB B-repeat-containing protein, partial [Roseburia intestinalis]|uniref:InlB B-repeat-containing protein n=2 Tax=Roseburia intestinalis TaxID=166486 RepID=UPI002ED34BF5